jgi:hypothetical protein
VTISLPSLALNGERKYTIAIIIILLATALVSFDKLSGRQWVDITGATMLFFGASNVGEHWTRRKGGKDVQGMRRSKAQATEVERES